MDLPHDVRSTLFRAGSDALRFNAPLADDRAVELIDQLGRAGCRSVVDLGCGRGELARLVATRLPDVAVVGVDTDDSAIDTARRLTAAAGIDDRVRFEVGDAARWSGPVDAAICIGASHAFGGPNGLLTRLADLIPAGTAFVGDGVWQSEPDPWCREAFGELPHGVEGLTFLATSAGWTVESAGLSTPAEWDAFEGGWVDGVRSVGTTIAETFADERRREYETHYRGVLGFCWLMLSR